MNKRFYFILIPIFVVLFSLSSKAGSHLSDKKKLTTGFCITIKIDRNNIPHSVNLRKENSERNIYKIRTKAWDDAATANIPCEQAPVTIFCYYTRPVYCRYNFSFRPYHLSKQSLRGPPVA